MVSKTDEVAITSSEQQSQHPFEQQQEPTLPQGFYRLVGFDLDLTGRRLIDEIVHIAGYTPKLTFSQYVLPFRYLNNEARYRHMLRIITVSRFRMLKSDKTGKILKTKSEISAVTDFVQWLESLKADNIILLTHEQRKTVPLFLLEVLKKYGLYERFCKIVKGFANTYQLAQAKCAETVKSYSIYSMCMVLLDKEEDLDSAANRARITYKIAQHLCAVEEEASTNTGDNPSESALAAMSEGVRLIAHSIAQTEDDLAGLKKLVERQNTLKPIFGAMIKTKFRYERYRASNLRRLIAEANITYDDLTKEWNGSKADGLKKLIVERVTNARKQQDIDDLTEILIAHFDPQYKPNLPSRRPRRAELSQSEEKPSEQQIADINNGINSESHSSGMSTPAKYSSAPSSPIKETPVEDNKGENLEHVDSSNQADEQEQQTDANTSR